MLRLILAFGVVGGCDFFEEEPPPAPVQVVAKADTGEAEEAKEEKAPAKPPRTATEKGWDLLVAGDPSGAIDAAKGLMEADSVEAWRLIEAAVLASEKPAEVALPDGAPELLSGRIKLATGDAQGAFDVATAAIGDGTNGDALALMAEAVRAGVETGETEEWPDSAKAMLAWVTARDSRRAAPHAAAAAAVSGWRADLVRAKVSQDRRDIDGALAAYEAAASSDEPLAVLKANAARGQLAADGSAKGLDPQVVRDWADAGLAAALTHGTAAEIGSAVQAAHDVYAGGSQPVNALKVARTALDRLNAGEGADASGAALLTANAALHAGELQEAMERAKSVLEVDANTESTGHQWAQFILGMAAFELGDGEALKTAAAGARGAQKDALKALSAMHSGDMANARLQFPPSGLSNWDAVLVYPYAAQADAQASGKWLDQAARAADATGALAYRISTRLAMESNLRAISKNGASSIRRTLSKMTPAGTSGEGLQAELAVREVLAGNQGPVAVPGPEVIQAWDALGQRIKPTSVKGKNWKAIMRWAHGRYVATRGDLEGREGHFQAALATMPLHRFGRMATGTAMDGSQGIDIDTDLAILGKMKGEDAASMALSAHDVGHRMDSMRMDLALGWQPYVGLSAEDRTTLLSEFARLRARVRAWHAGVSEFPNDGFDAIAEAEAVAGKTESFAAVLPVKGASAEDLLSGYGRGAVVSYRASHGRLQGVALSRVGTAVRDLGSAKEIFALAEQYRQAMAVSAGDKKTKTDHSAGHKLRERVLDPFIGDLTGVGRYAIVAPPALQAFPFTTLPEQAEGLRWLADIRQMASAPTVRALTRELREVDAETYKIDFLAFGPDEREGEDEELTDFETPDELRVCGRYFQSGQDEVLVGGDATLANWKEKAGTARYIHIADLPPTTGGGFKMSDGEISLNDVRNTALHAELVLISARTTADQQMHRARAFLDAGARWVLISTWQVPDRVRIRYLSEIYASMNQERPPIRALSEGRQALFRDSLTGVDLDDPSLWGGVVLFGKP